uniref:Uncharacterized protein n=1 Tax=Sinocyclocheilus anshuiensis TaxID=1608454 RepID=A0A671LDV7_9TELE
MSESVPTSPKLIQTRRQSLGTPICNDLYSSFVLSTGPLAEELQCSVCLEVFTDPVSTPCGHNFCKSCLNQCWSNSQECKCPICNETFSKRPDLKINTALRQVSQLMKSQKDVQQMIQDKIKKIQDVEHATELRKKSTGQENTASVELCTALIRSIERCQAELLDMMEEKQKAAEKQEEKLIQELQQELTELKMRNTELDHLSHNEDHLHLLQIDPSLCSPPHTRNWPEISMNTDVNVETLRRALTQLQETLDEKLIQTVFRRMQQYAVDVTLDPDTTHPYLILSDDGKQVRHGDIKQKLPNNPERFDHYPGVLGKEGFSSGRFYFEVQVKEKIEWNLGVARESINRKGLIKTPPHYGFWTVRLRNGNGYWALKPQKVGVFLDYEEGLVSLYDVVSRSHIYSFTGQSFKEKLCPLFNPELNNGGKNSAPLISSPDIYNE